MHSNAVKNSNKDGSTRDKCIGTDPVRTPGRGPSPLPKCNKVSKSGNQNNVSHHPKNTCKPRPKDPCATILEVDSRNNYNHIHQFREIRCAPTAAERALNRFARPIIEIPSWLNYCGVVLKFYGYFQEPIPESPLETYRVHRCEIRYYMENDTIEVYEPATFDPGYVQGRLIQRGRIPIPSPCQDAYYTLEHLNVGCEVTFYGKTFAICGCDSFTRRFLNRLGYPVLENMEVPCDPATVCREDAVLSSHFARRAAVKLEPKKGVQFLTNYRKVLRFWAYWDDRCNLYGNLRHFVLNYYLEDDTISVTEIHKQNSGYEPFAPFVARSKVPKDTSKLINLPGVKEEALLVLNVVDLTRCGCTIGRSVVGDRLCPGINEPEKYTDKDLAIGATLNIYGRCFILTDCDEFTKRYYMDKYGMSEDSFTPLTLNECEQPLPLPRMEVPPHIGFGDEEDTYCNWDRIRVTRPKKDHAFLMQHEKDVLGFCAQLYKTLQKVNSVRRFVFKFYMCDGTLQIFEKEHPNSGLKKGTFLARMRVKKPACDPMKKFVCGDLPEYFIAEDFYIGAIVVINGFQFILTDADEFTLSFMEHHRKCFPQSDVCLILHKVREALGPWQAADVLCTFSQKDTCKQGVMSYSDFRTLLLDYTKCGLSEHEVITLKRAYRVDAPEPGPDWDTVKAVVQTELKRFHFDKPLLERLEYTLRYHDPCKTGLVDRENLRSAFRGAKLPFAKELMDFLVDKWPCADECNRVNYCDIMKFLDWEKNGGLDALPSALPCILKWIEPKRPNEIMCVNYKAFLDDVCPNIKCALPMVCCPQDQDCCEQYEE